LINVSEHEEGEDPVLALGLANRSAVLVQLKEYSMAIRDIQLSVQFGYPSDQRLVDDVVSFHSISSFCVL
jgi:hypothetical protein